MAYVIPNSTVEYFKDIGINHDYSDVPYFATTKDKDDTFTSFYTDSRLREKYYIAREEGLSYISKDGKTLRSSLPMSTLINAGYMRFKNTEFENKWFYAFIDSVDYANNGMVEITFSIDVITTWMGSFDLGECFVERMHVRNDAIGANLCDEGLETGDYIYRNIYKSNTMQDWSIIVQATVNEDHSPAEGEIIGNIYNGCRLLKFRNAAAVNEWISGLTDDQKSDAIVAIGMMPESYASEMAVNHHEVIISKPYSDIDGYIPKNNKLFTYPYNLLAVTNSEGNFADFRYEFFSSNSAYFIIEGIRQATPEIICSPVFYKNVTGKGYPEKMSMSGFPMCSYTVDAYRAYLAQNRSNVAVQALSTVSSGDLRAVSSLNSAINFVLPGLSTITGLADPYMGAAMNILGNGNAGISSLLQKQYEYSQKPPQAGGAQGSDTLVAVGAKDFYFMPKQITANYAEMIDDYFTMFGYAVRQVMKPSMKTRQKWTFVKTRGAVVHGNLPSQDASAIENILNNGVRFWADIEIIGSYGDKNNPVLV